MQAQVMSRTSDKSPIEELIARAAKTSTHYVDKVLISRMSQRLLSQCSGAQIDPYCQFVVMVASQQLKQSIEGQRRISTALSNLNVYSLPDEKVQLGWTSEHALKNQGVHDGGYEHLAIEVLLTEAFHDERYAARVLHELAVAYAGPEDIIPHFDQLVNQVHSSNGIFTNTNFARLLEDYTLLDPSNRSLKGGLKKVSVPSPRSMADALQLLAKVTDGREKQMTVIGGSIIAWFAAAAEWLFDLRVSIYTSNGECLSSSHNEQISQLLLIYNSHPGILAQVGTWSSDSEQAKHVAASSPHAGATSLTQFGGRLVYNVILVRVFGTSFRHLDREESRIFGTAIGSCARILQDIAENHDASTNTKRSAATYGQGLLTTLCNWLPELRHLQGRMERQLQLIAEDAGKVYTEQIQHLKSICGCDICCPKAEGVEKKPGLEGYCLPSLTETVIALGLLLSNIVVAPAIFPTRFGLQQYYMQQAQKRLTATLENTSGPELFQALYYDVPDTTRLVQVAEIFSGSAPTKDLHPNLVALAHEGICVYLVRKLERDDSQDGLISVSSGSICVRQKINSRACLGPVEVEDELGDVWEEVKCTHLEKSLWCK